MLGAVRYVAATGAKSAVSDCILFKFIVSINLCRKRTVLAHWNFTKTFSQKITSMRISCFGTMPARDRERERERGVSWSLTSHFSTNMAISETRREQTNRERGTDGQTTFVYHYCALHIYSDTHDKNKTKNLCIICI